MGKRGTHSHGVGYFQATIQMYTIASYIHHRPFFSSKFSLPIYL